MAERLADVVAQIQNVRQLEAVVTAMRGIAASRAQRGRALLAGIDAYSNVVSRAIGHALILMPADTRYASRPRAGTLGLFCFARSKASPELSANEFLTRRQAMFLRLLWFSLLELAAQLSRTSAG